MTPAPTAPAAMQIVVPPAIIIAPPTVSPDADPGSSVVARDDRRAVGDSSTDLEKKITLHFFCRMPLIEVMPTHLRNQGL
ncbi:MAG: hypothetical protein LBU24_06200 [Methanocalculaceae archaeon]|nr:hypothetical protein [Methanocalculaceae archaeon]